MRSSRWYLLLAAIVLPGLILLAQSPAPPLTQKDPPDGTEAAVKQATGFRLPPGLKAELFAAEPKLMNPVAFCLDEKGRVFVAEEFRLNRGTEENRGRSFLLDDDLQVKTVEDRLKMYEKHAAKFGGMDYFRKYTDQVRLLEDTTGSGRADKSTIFATGFNDPLDGLAAGILAWNGSIYLTNIPNLWKLDDKGNGGTAVVRQPLLTGFGVSCAFLGHDLHGLTVGPDGKLYFSIGDRGYNVTNKEGKNFTGLRTGAVFRCNFDGSEFEVIHKGLRNPQELAFDQYGNLFADDNNCDKGDHARLVYICEGGDSGWNMAFQTIPEPYMAGPWFAERMWHLPHEGQPAWLLPPVGKIGTGPGGFAFSSGVGLPERYKNTFLMANYAGGGGGIEAFKVKPKGAGFEIEDYHDFLKPLMPTDVEIGYDGKVYVSEFGPLKWDGSNNQGRIYTVFDPKKQSDPAVLFLKAIIAEDFEKLEADALVDLIHHIDMRVRMRAQFALVKKDPMKFWRILKQSENQLSRLHAIWGIGMASEKKHEFAAPLAEYLKDADHEIRCQAAKVLGQRSGVDCNATLVKLLTDDGPRVRYFAAEALGRRKCKEGVDQIFDVLRQNNNADPHLRHACVTALANIGDADAVLKHARNTSAAVRLGVVLSLRKLSDPRLSAFLNDPDLFIRTESARAIHDLPIESEYPALAEVLTKLPNERLQEADPLLRRAIHAAFRLGTKEQAERVLKVAANPNVSLAIRSEALGCLRDWSEPGPRDRVTGFWRPLEKRDPAIIKGVVEAGRETLLSLNSQKLQIEAITVMVKAGAKIDDELFRSWVADPNKQTALRVAALRSLDARMSPVLKTVLQTALKDSAPILRATARELLAQSDPAAGTAELLAVLQKKDAALVETQAAITMLPRVKSKEANDALDDLAKRLCDADFPKEWIVDTLEALKAAPTPTREVLRKKYEDPLPKDPVGKYQMSLVGGDAERGRELFYNHTGAQCVRCHKVRDSGGVAGPDLTDVAKRYPEKTRDFLLESLVLPSAKIAPGFGTISVSLDDGRVLTGVLLQDDKTVTLQLPDGKKVSFPSDSIEKRTAVQSAMPTVDRTLTPREMRDLIEFLSSLK